MLHYKSFLDVLINVLRFYRNSCKAWICLNYSFSCYSSKIYLWAWICALVAFNASIVKKASDHSNNLWKYDPAPVHAFQVECSFPCGSIILKKLKNSVFSVENVSFKYKTTLYRFFLPTRFLFYASKKRQCLHIHHPLGCISKSWLSGEDWYLKCFHQCISWRLLGNVLRSKWSCPLLGLILNPFVLIIFYKDLMYNEQRT